MEDFTKSNVLNKHIESDIAMIDSITRDLMDLKTNILYVSNSILQDQKVISDLINKVDEIIISNGISLSPSIKKSNIHKVPSIIEDICVGLKKKKDVKDELESISKKISIKLLTIDKKRSKLLTLESRLSEHYIKEDDYDDEVVINIKEIKRQREEAALKESKSKLEQYVNEASEDLENIISAAFGITNEEDNIVEVSINKKYSLEELCLLYYENKKYWEYIYNIEENKELLDYLCNENNVTINKLVKMDDVLLGYTLKFPKELKTYSFIPKESNKRKAA